MLSQKGCFYSLSYLFHTSFIPLSYQIRNKFDTNSNDYEFVSNLYRICIEFVSNLLRI